MLLIKIGGGARINVEGIVADLAALSDRFVILHGANAFRDKLAEKLGNPPKIIKSLSGYSSVFTDEKALDVLMMAYAGFRNKRIVELCQQHEINAVGLTGLDGKIIEGRRNKGIRINDNGKIRIVRDFSGKPKGINKSLLNLLLDNGFTPVLTVPIIDENNFAISSENDDILILLQQTLHADKIIQLIEAPGLLEKKEDPTSLLHEVSALRLKQYEELAEGRMKRKLRALIKLFENEASYVIISDGTVAHPVKDALNGKGTIIS